MEKLLMNGQEVKLKNPGTKGLKPLLRIQQEMSEGSSKYKGTKEQIAKQMEEDNYNPMANLSEKGIDSLTELIDLSLHKTFPDYTDEVDEWAMTNAFTIMSNVLELCSPKTETDDESRIEALKNKLQNDKSSAKD